MNLIKVWMTLRSIISWIREMSASVRIFLSKMMALCLSKLSMLKRPTLRNLHATLLQRICDLYNLGLSKSLNDDLVEGLKMCDEFCWVWNWFQVFIASLVVLYFLFDSGRCENIRLLSPCFDHLLPRRFTNVLHVIGPTLRDRCWVRDSRV